MKKINALQKLKKKTKPEIQFIAQKDSLLSHLVLEICIVNLVKNVNLCRNRVDTNYLQEKVNYELLILILLLSMLSVHLCIHTREYESHQSGWCGTCLHV